MARNFNRLLNGLLGYVDQKSDGRLPAYLAETTQGTIDLDRWLQVHAAVYEASHVSGLATNTSQTLPLVPTLFPPIGAAGVPEGEMWLLYDFGIRLSVENTGPGPAGLVAGDFLMMQAQISVQARTIPIAPMDKFLVTGPSIDLVGVTMPVVQSYRQEPILVRPGEELVANFQTSLQSLTSKLFVLARGRLLRFPV